MQYGVKISRGARHVITQASDRRFGYGGKTVGVMLPGR